jgi:hypothetical protein
LLYSWILPDKYYYCDCCNSLQISNSNKLNAVTLRDVVLHKELICRYSSCSRYIWTQFTDSLNVGSNFVWLIAPGKFIWPFRIGYNWGRTAKQGRSAVYGGLRIIFKTLKLLYASERNSRHGKVVRTGRSGLEPELEGHQSMSGLSGFLN